MKKISLFRSLMFGGCLVFNHFAYSQATEAADYYFTAKTGTYTALSGGTSISSVEVDDGLSGSLPIGFTFTYCGVDYTNIYASSNGWITFGSSPYIYAYPGSTGFLSTGSSSGIGPAVMPLWDDVSGDSGTASYETSGSSPNRVFTIEFKDWLWDFSTTTPAISFQVKLFEGTNVIQILYKQESGTPFWDYSDGATIGIGGGSSDDFLSLNNSSSSPTASSTTLTVDITDKPATNQIYQFAPYPECIGTPVVLTPAGPNTRVCPGADFTLAENTAVVILGKTYQWQSRPAGVGAFTDIPGATSDTLTTSITDNTEFQLVVTCASSGLSKTSPLKTVNVLKPVSITASGPLSFCDNQPFALSAVNDTGLNYQWVNTSSGDIAGATDTAYTPDVTGRYTLRVSTPACLSGVPSEDTLDVTVKTAPDAVISPAPSLTFCIGSSATLNGSGSGNYQWVSASSGVIPGATASSYNTAVAGDYYLVITDPVNGCADTSDNTTVIASPKPTVSIGPAGTTNVCTGLSITLNSVTTGLGLSYQWYNSSGPLSGADMEHLTTFDEDDYFVVVSAGTCSDTSNIAGVRLLPLPPATISSTGTTAVVCPANSDLVLEANIGLGYTYQWYLADAALPGAAGLRYTVPVAGTYKVRVTDAYGCYSYSDTFVAVNTPAARPTVSPRDVAFCQGTDIRLYAAPDMYTTAYQWLKNDTLLPGDTLAALDVVAGGYYRVIVTDSFNCITPSDAVNVLVYDLPVKPLVTLSGNMLSTTVYKSFQWYRNKKAIPGATSRTFLAHFSGEYYVEVSNENNCYNSSDPEYIDLEGTGISGQQPEGSIRLYPNPSEGIVYIDAARPVNVLVKDLQGKQVFREEQVSVVDMQGWAPGLYFFLLSAADGSILKTEKVTRSGL